MTTKKKAKPSPEPSLADALLDAHVAFQIERLTTAELPGLIEALLDTALAQLGTLKLDKLVTRAQIKATARTWAIELDMRGGIPELVGDIARALHAHPIHERTRLSDLLTQRRFDDLLDLVLSQQALRRRVVEALIESPVYERMASELLYNGVRDYLARGAAGTHIPGARSALKLGRAMVSRASPGLERAMEEGLKQQIGRSVRSVSSKSVQPLLDGKHDEAVRDMLRESWAQLGRVRLGPLRKDFSERDLEEWFVTLYEHWKELRGTEFIGVMIDSGIDTFFDKYGPQTLAELLEDLGITRPLMLAEALRFGPPVLAQLHKAKRLDPLLSHLLEPFYRSGRVEKLLARRSI